LVARQLSAQLGRTVNLHPPESCTWNTAIRVPPFPNVETLFAAASRYTDKVADALEIVRRACMPLAKSSKNHPDFRRQENDSSQKKTQPFLMLIII